jgi:hypothetical protein
LNQDDFDEDEENNIEKIEELKFNAAIVKKNTI